nr:hypothetical protein [Tanacetum cinerariifolium]
MTCSTVKRLTKPHEEPKREFWMRRKSAQRPHQNESLAIAGTNLFDDEASSSYNTGAKPPTPPKTLHEHHHPNSSGFLYLITFPIKQTGRIIDSRDIWLIQNMYTFQGLRNEDPLRHIRHYLNIIDNIQADGATRDISRKLTQFASFRFDSLTEDEGWNQIEEYVQYQDDPWDDVSPPMNISSILEAMQPTLRGFLKGLAIKFPSSKHLLERGDIYDDHSLLRFYQNDDTPPWGNIKHKKKERMAPRIFKLKPTKMSIQLAGRSIKYPIGICENLLVKISKCIFPVDFLVLEMYEDELVPIILGRPFLTTARAVIDVHKIKLSLRVGSKTVTFNIGKSMKPKHSHDNYIYYADHTAKLVQEQWVDTVNHDGELTKEEERNDPNEVLAVSFYPRIKPMEALEWKAPKN